MPRPDTRPSSYNLFEVLIRDSDWGVDGDYNFVVGALQIMSKELMDRADNGSTDVNWQLDSDKQVVLNYVGEDTEFEKFIQVFNWTLLRYVDQSKPGYVGLTHGKPPTAAACSQLRTLFDRLPHEGIE